MKRISGLAFVLFLLAVFGCESPPATAPPEAPEAPPLAARFPVTGLDIVAVSAGKHACGLTKGGQALCWGRNESGELGDGGGGEDVFSSVPVPVSSGLAFTSVSAGLGHTCGVTKGGQALCWGSNSVGQLGDGGTVDSNSNVPVPVSGGFNFTSMSAGVQHTCGVTKKLGAWCWGRNDDGELGDGSLTDKSGPSPVAGS